MSNIPNGTYRAKAVGKPEIIESEKKLTPGITVELELAVSSGPERLTWTGWLSDAALPRTVESLRYLGWKGADLDQVDGLDQEVEVVVKAEEYEGNFYPRIQFINRLGGAMGGAMADEKKKTFAASMRDRIKALDAAGPRRATPKATQATEPPHSADQGNFDVPF